MSKGPKHIYHITHKDNLEGIIPQGGLVAQSVMVNDPIPYCNIAHATIQDRRAQTPVPCGPGGHLHDYVPFYFAPRSPMLYAIHRGNVDNCTAGQADIVYLVSSTESVAASELEFVFTNGHGIMALSDFFDDLDNLTLSHKDASLNFSLLANEEKILEYESVGGTRDVVLTTDKPDVLSIEGNKINEFFSPL